MSLPLPSRLRRCAGTILAPLTAMLLLGCREVTNSDAFAHPHMGGPAPEAAVEWVRQHAMPLRSVDAPAEAGDLASLDSALGPARVVALGEATHGTHQFFKMKHRLLEYFVGQRGFKSFVLEADGAAACDLDAYVKTGVGDPLRLVRELRFWTWNTQEIVDLMRWMRAYNERVAPDQAISFHGIDMQNPYSSSRKVVSFLRQVDPGAARRAESSYHCLDPLRDPNAIADRYPHLDVQTQLDCARSIGDVYRSLSQNRARYESKSPAAYSCALLGARLMMEGEVLFRVQSVRDSYYADNVLALLEPAHQGRKVVVWAHNTHIANVRGAMGRKLKKALGAAYVTIGLTFHGGSFRARPRSADGGAGPPVPIRAPPPRADSYEAAFHRAGLPRFLLDLRPLRSGPDSSAWLAQPHPMWLIGGAYDPARSSSPSRLAEEYDYLIYFDQTQASQYPARRSPGS